MQTSRRLFSRAWPVPQSDRQTDGVWSLLVITEDTVPYSTSEHSKIYISWIFLFTSGNVHDRQIPSPVGGPQIKYRIPARKRPSRLAGRLRPARVGWDWTGHRIAVLCNGRCDWWMRRCIREDSERHTHRLLVMFVEGRRWQNDGYVGSTFSRTTDKARSILEVGRIFQWIKNPKITKLAWVSCQHLRDP